MNDLILSIFSTEIYESRIEKLKALFVYILLGIISVLVIVISTITLRDGGIANPAIPLTALGILIPAYLLVRNRRLSIASWLIVMTFITVVIVNNVLDGSIGSLTLLINIVLIIIAGFLLGTRGIALATFSSVIQIFAFATIEGVVQNSFSARIPIAIIYLGAGAIIYAYNQFITTSRLEGEDIEGERRLKLADVNMRITRQASARESLETALNSTLALILENYPQIYHAQVFLVERDGIQAKLAASTGEIGRRLLANKHSLAVGSLSVIGQTTLGGEAIIAKSNDNDSVHRNNELLPETQLEAAFPLIVGTTIIGALDLQSKVLEDLSENDRLSFQSLANSLALAIDSIRQFDQAKARIEENQRLTEQTRTALREVERLNQRLIGRAWTNYVQGLGDELGLVSDFDTETTASYLDWSDTLVAAVNTDSLVQEGNLLAIPLRVRGQVIGAVEFELEEYQDFSPEDLDLITEVTERFGLAAENTRLVEESQQTAQREALINQITSRFQSAQNVEATLAEAARSLNESLNTRNVVIRLGVPETSPNGKDS